MQFFEPKKPPHSPRLPFQGYHIVLGLFHNGVDIDHDNTESRTGLLNHQLHQRIRKQIRLDQKQFLVVQNRDAVGFQRVVAWGRPNLSSPEHRC